MAKSTNKNPVNPAYDCPVRPLGDNIVTVRETEEKYVGSIYIPETAKEKPMGAKVVAIGPEVTTIAIGDFVLVGRYAGADCSFRKVDYTIIRASEVLGIVPDGGDSM
jgi:chaperonin GroES